MRMQWWAVEEIIRQTHPGRANCAASQRAPVVICPPSRSHSQAASAEHFLSNSTPRERRVAARNDGAAARESPREERVAGRGPLALNGLPDRNYGTVRCVDREDGAGARVTAPRLHAPCTGARTADEDDDHVIVARAFLAHRVSGKRLAKLRTTGQPQLWVELGLACSELNTRA